MRTSDAIIATTWSGGTNAVEQTDWTPLRGKRVRVFPDNDAPGRKAASKIVGTLNTMGDGTHAVVAILPELPGKGDVVDFIAVRMARQETTMRQSRRRFKTRKRPKSMSVSARRTNAPATRALEFI